MDKIRFVELGLLKEVNPREMLIKGYGAVDRRIAKFEKWIESRPEDQIVVVGHSIYFKRMLGQHDTFDNCDVWELTYSTTDLSSEKNDSSSEENESNLPRAWSDMRKMYHYNPDHDEAAVDADK